MSTAPPSGRQVESSAGLSPPRTCQGEITVKLLPSAPCTARLAVIATLGVLLAPAVARATGPTFVQGAAFATGSRVLTSTVTLTRPVASGDLLVGWLAQYDVQGQVQVADN